MSDVKLSSDEQKAHDKIVDELNQEYADCATPEFIAEQHSKQSGILSTDFEMPHRGNAGAKTSIHMLDNDK